MKCAILLSCYNKVDDLMAHLDILKFNSHPVIICYLNPDIDKKYLDVIHQYPHVTMQGAGFSLGPLLSLVYGVRKAKEMGIDYLVFRNADDWLFNHEQTDRNFKYLHKHNYLCAGYNWLSQNTTKEFAMNEMYIHVDSFVPTSEEAEAFFLKSTKRTLCENKIGQWIKAAIKSWDRFYRLPGRETAIGIGHDASAIHYIYNSDLQKPIPDEIWTEYAVNNRFFNKDWQLIGSHNNKQRHAYWEFIKDNVPYAAELEKETEFARWLTADVWNMPNSDDHIESRKRPKTKKVPKRLMKR